MTYLIEATIVKDGGTVVHWKLKQELFYERKL